MKNKILIKEIAKKRWVNKLKRKKKKINHNISNAQIKIYKNSLKNDSHIIKNNKSKLYEFLHEVGFIEYFEIPQKTIPIPKIFSIELDNRSFRRTIGEIIFSAFNNSSREITLDFSKCEISDESSIFFLNIILMEIKDYFRKLNNKLSVVRKNLKIELIKSKTKKINILLFLYRNIKDFDFREFNIKEEDLPIKHLGYLKGEKTKKHYLENKKNIFTTEIVKYINGCLEHSNYCFSPTGRNEIEGIISEILNNAEDHSPMNTYYVTSTFSLNISEEEKCLVGVLNINFLNFGYSFYDGLTENKLENKNIYDVLENKSKGENFKNFSKEEIFTLFALQDGISRLKYEDESRGTGTMKFIVSFMNIGDYEDKSKNLIPYLKIFSGKTLLICNKVYQPYIKDGRYCLSLNAEKDLNKEPDKNNLKLLDTKFPGTLISVKVYLNEKNLDTKIKKNDS